MSTTKPVIVTITGIRPDFIRMSAIFKALDREFNHILIHTGQHYDKSLSDTFFKELGIRDPDYILDTGKSCTNHYEQLAYLSVNIPKLFADMNIHPDLILFLGDSNTAGVAFPLKKQGYCIGHIEAGMRSYDKRMLEELNRTVCDHCSDILFVYHEDYKAQLALENITQNVFVVGNTIVEPFMQFKPHVINSQQSKANNLILLDIHRPENFNYPDRLAKIIKFANTCSAKYGLPVKLLYFKRLVDNITEQAIDLGEIHMVPLMSFREYLTAVYNSRFIISDSGTGQEEPALLGTPVIVPRDFTERPQSFAGNCSIQYKCSEDNCDEIFCWIADLESGKLKADITWLGNGTTSSQVIQHLKEYLQPPFSLAGEPTSKRERNSGVGLEFDMNGTGLLTRLSSQQYKNAQPFPHIMLDNFLDDHFAKDIQAEILACPDAMWDRYENPFEQKYTLRDKYAFPPQLAQLFTELTSPAFITDLSGVVGYDLMLDTTRNFWGVHKYKSGDKLDIHVDAGYHPTLTGLKKQVTLGIYLSYNWQPNNNYGCELELWKGDNCAGQDARIHSKASTIEPLFNRLIIFTCNDYSWHGNPIPANCPADSQRIFVTISYLSVNHEDLNKRVKAFFVPRPGDPIDEEKDRLRFLRADPDKYKDIYRL